MVEMAGMAGAAKAEAVAGPWRSDQLWA
jgi:hypothetical protein